MDLLCDGDSFCFGGARRCLSGDEWICVGRRAL